MCPFSRSPCLSLVCHSLSRCILITHLVHEARFFSTTFALKSCSLVHLSSYLIIHSQGSSPQLLSKLLECLGESCAAVQSSTATSFLALSCSVAVIHLSKMTSVSKDWAWKTLSHSFLFDINLVLPITFIADNLLQALPEHLSCQFSILCRLSPCYSRPLYIIQLDKTAKARFWYKQPMRYPQYIFPFRNITRIWQNYWEAAQLRIIPMFHVDAYPTALLQRLKQLLRKDLHQSHTRISSRRLAPCSTAFIHLNLSVSKEAIPCRLFFFTQEPRDLVS